MQRWNGCNRRGFTLVELLVVVGIVVTLIALLAPAVQASREAARRLKCANNLRQIGLALQLFHDVHAGLPPGGVDPARTPTTVHRRFGIPHTGVTHGWAVFLLPYLDHQALHDGYDFRQDWRAPANGPVREAALPVFVCPSAPEPGRFDTSTSGGFSNWQAACGDYGVCNAIDSGRLFNLGLIDAATRRHPRGMMRVNVLDPLSDARDGLSNTMWICEDAGRPQRYQLGAPEDGRTSGGGWADRENAFTFHGFDRATRTSGGSCPLNCTNSNEIYSFHPGGALVVRGDGSTHFLAETLELRVVAQLLTCAAGEVVGEY
jgi:prepilin-type N-terminal cleavage/methylation domain-containing protein